MSEIMPEYVGVLPGNRPLLESRNDDREQERGCCELRTRVTRIARGVPVGGELEYVDAGTLAQAMVERRSV